MPPPKKPKKTKRKRRSDYMKTWRFLGKLQASELEVYGTHWKPYQRNKLALRCLKDPKCGYKLIWHSADSRLDESGEHRHRGGRAADGTGAGEGQQQFGPPSLLMLAPFQTGPFAATPIYKLGIAAARDEPDLAYNNLTHILYGIQGQGNSVAPRLPHQLEEDESEDTFAIEKEQDEGEQEEDDDDDGEDEEDGPGHGQQQEQEAEEDERSGEKQPAHQQGPELHGEGGGGWEEAAMEGQQNIGGETLEEGSGGGGEAAGGNGRGEALERGMVMPFRLTNLQAAFRKIAIEFGIECGCQKAGDVLCLWRENELEGARDSLLFEDQGPRVKVTETRSRKWHSLTSGQTAEKLARQCQQWTKADMGQFLLAVRGHCLQLLSRSQLQWE